MLPEASAEAKDTDAEVCRPCLRLNLPVPSVVEESDKDSVEVVGSGIGGGRLPLAFVDVGDGTVHVAFCVTLRKQMN